MENLCRLCLKEGGQHENVFNTKYGFVIADLVITICPSLTILENDFITKEICAECLQTVWQACELRQRSVESEDYLNSKGGIFTVDFVKQEVFESEDDVSLLNAQVLIKEEHLPKKLAKSRPYKVECPQCFKSVSPKSLSRHMKVKHGNDLRKSKASTEETVVTGLLNHYKEELQKKVAKTRPSRVECPHCRDVVSPKSLSRHIRVKHGKDLHNQRENAELYSCGKIELLPKKVASKRPLRVECPQCLEVLSPKSLLRHTRLKHGKDMLDSKASTEENKNQQERVCQYCEQKFSKYYDWNKHLETAHADQLKHDKMLRQPIGCSFCFSRFSSAIEMKKHLVKKHGIDDPNLLFYYCAHCSYSTNHKLQLEVHIKGHFGISAKPFLCSVCGNGFMCQRNLRKHLFRLHKISNANQFFCNDCEFNTLQKVKLELHMNRVHLKTVSDFFCDICEIVCKTKMEKSLHHYAHSDIVEVCDQSLQLLGCPICPMQFHHEEELLQHLPTHEEEASAGPTACILCSIVLEDFNQIVEHTKAQHVQKFTHRCTECKRNYYYGMRFLIHIKHHKEKKTFDQLCTECGAAFTSIADLNKHVKIEHKEFYKCPYCVDVVYKSIPAFRQHVDGHTNKRKYKCPLCPKTFSVRNKYNSHYAFHLNDKVS